MGANRFLAVPSPHGRLVLRAWLAAERCATRAPGPPADTLTAVPAPAIGRAPLPAAHPLPPPHFSPLLGASRKFAAAPQARPRLGFSQR